MASTYGNLGNVLHTRGDLDGAEQMHRKALALAVRIGAASLEEKLMSNLSRLEEIHDEKEDKNSSD